MMQNVPGVLKRLGKTQGDLAAAIGVREETLSRWVNGHTMPDGDKVHAVLSYLRGLDSSITYDQLFGDELAAAEVEPAADPAHQEQHS